MSTNNCIKRAAASPAGGGAGTETKRQRRTLLQQQPVVSSSNDEPSAQEEPRGALERKLEDLLAGIEAKQQDRSRIEREISLMSCQVEQVKAQLRSLDEQPAKEERQRRRRDNPRIREVLSSYKNGTVELDVLLYEQFPYLIDNIEFWSTFLDAVCHLPLTSKVFEILFDRKPLSVLNNKELMLRLCKHDPRIYFAISRDSQLKDDAQLVEIVLDLFPLAVMFVDGPVPLQNAVLMGKALARLPLWYKSMHDAVKRNVNTNSWRNRDVVAGWVKGGGQLHTGIPQSLWEDQEILLPACGKIKPTELPPPRTPEHMRGNLKFMKKAVKKNPGMLSQVSENLKGSKDLAVAALSGKHGALAVHCWSDQFLPGEGNLFRRKHRFWCEISEWIREKLRMRDAYIKLVLGSIHFSESKPSNLAILDQGEATSEALKKLIAEYAGVPVGEELGNLYIARKTLAYGGIPWSD